MGGALFAIVVMNATLFASLGVIGARYAWRDPSPRIRVLAGALTAVCAAFVLGAATRATALAVREGWLPGQVGDFLVSEWSLIQSLGATGFALVTIWQLRRVSAPIRRAEQIVTVLSDRFAPEAPVSELGLTARELEVLEVIAAGTLSDKEIAETLYISPATAGTHVKNIMRKAGVSSRRDLVLLAAADEQHPGTARKSGPTGSR